MPRTPAQRSIRDARCLAQKLYSQCRDSSTGYRVLAQLLRKLRNALEDFEEFAADRQAQWVISPRFTLQLDACTSLLQELDLTLQSHRCSTHKWQDVHQQTIVRLEGNISKRVEGLSILYETILRVPDESVTSPITPLVEATTKTAPAILAECDGDTFMIVAVEDKVQEKRPRRFSWEDDEGVNHEEVLMKVRSEVQMMLSRDPVIAPTLEEIEEDMMSGGISQDSIPADDDASTLAYEARAYEKKTSLESIAQHATETTAERIASATAEADDTVKSATADILDMQEETVTQPIAEQVQPPSTVLNAEPSVENMNSTHTPIVESAESALVDVPHCSDNTSPKIEAAHDCQKILTEDEWDAAFHDFENSKETSLTQTSTEVVPTTEPQRSTDTVVKTQKVQPDDVDTSLAVDCQDTTSEHPPPQSDTDDTALRRSSSQNDTEDTTSKEQQPQVDTRDGTAPLRAVSGETTAMTSPFPEALESWLTPSTGSSMFQLPFAAFDPLTMDIDSASSFLLGAEDAEPSRSVTPSQNASPQPTCASTDGPESQAEIKKSASCQISSLQSSATTDDRQQCEEGEDIMTTAAEQVLPGEDIIVQVDETSAAASATLASAASTILPTIAAGLGITFESSSTSSETAEVDVTDKRPVQDDILVDHAGISRNDADNQTQTQQSHPPFSSTVMELARNDSVHATNTTRTSHEDTDRPLSPIDQLLASFHEDENALAEQDSAISSLKAKWLSLRPSSPLAKFDGDMIRSKFSLHHQLRRVSFRTKSAVNEPPRVNSKTSLNDSISEEDSNDLTAEKASQHVGSLPSTTTSTNEHTQLASPAFSATTSPLTISEQVLPAISPPQPVRAPPHTPDSESKLFLVPPAPPPKKYRIVNPSPPSVYSTMSEDLYSSSRPTSPVRFTCTEPVPEVETAEQPLSLASKEHSDAVSEKLHNALTHDSLAHRRSADQDIEQRYFRVELEEPDLKRGRRRSASALPNGPLRSASISAPSSLHEDEQHHNAASTVSSASAAYSVDNERLDRLCKCWRAQQWEYSASYLRGHLDVVLDQGDTDAARRVMHLLGVCTSYTGQWQKALSFFIAAIHAPVKSISKLDHGDLAAFYWLGDTYTLLNRRTEALVAYSIALQIHNRRAGSLASQAVVLRKEISTLLLGATPQELVASWERMKSSTEQATDSILDRSVLEPVMVASSLEVAAQCRPSNVYPRVFSRASALDDLEGLPTISTNITPESFKRGNPWPEPYDEFFCTGNVAAGRLCDQPISLLNVLVTQPIFKVPKSGPVGTTRLDCFTCNHLDWLIVAIRQCLTFLEMRWDEVASEKSSLFLCRFAVKSTKIITAHYYSISIFKQTLRPGYGVEVCGDGVKSARILAVSPDHVDGVHTSCDRRLRKLVRDYLAHAYKLWLKDGKKPVSESMLLTTSTSVREQAAGLLASSALMSIAPVLPLREKAVYA